jgi:hypothetical protein
MSQTTLWHYLKGRAEFLANQGELRVSDLNVPMAEMIVAIVEELSRLQAKFDNLKVTADIEE